MRLKKNTSIQRTHFSLIYHLKSRRPTAVLLYLSVKLQGWANLTPTLHHKAMHFKVTFSLNSHSQEWLFRYKDRMMKTRQFFIFLVDLDNSTAQQNFLIIFLKSIPATIRKCHSILPPLNIFRHTLDLLISLWMEQALLIGLDPNILYHYHRTPIGHKRTHCTPFFVGDGIVAHLGFYCFTSRKEKKKNNACSLFSFYFIFLSFYLLVS